MLIVLEISIGILHYFGCPCALSYKPWYIIDGYLLFHLLLQPEASKDICQYHAKHVKIIIDRKLLKHSDDMASIKDWKLMKYSRLISGAGDVITSLRSQVCSLLNGRKKMNFIKFYESSLSEMWNGQGICYS